MPGHLADKCECAIAPIKKTNMDTGTNLSLDEAKTNLREIISEIISEYDSRFVHTWPES